MNLTLGSITVSRSRLVVFVLAFTAVAGLPVSAQVINEVLFHEDPGNVDPLRVHEWVEIFNPGPGGVNLTGWKMTDRSGRLGAGARTSPSIVMPAGSYFVVHIAVGVNDLNLADGSGDYYTGDPPNTNLFDDSMDECALYSATAIVDIITWNAGRAGYVPGIAHNDAVAALQWTAGAFLNVDKIQYAPSHRFRVVRTGVSIGRSKDGTDANDFRDWNSAGGSNARRNSPKRQNLDRVYLVPGAPAAISPTKAWTIMVYMAGDNDLEGNAYDDLKEMETAGGSDANVNVVVMVDGLAMFRQAQLQGGNLVGDDTTAGKTWRFQVSPQVSPDYVTMINQPGDNSYRGEVNMAGPDELAGFIAWAKARYPAQKYALILWDHGGGWKYLCEDDFNVSSSPPPHNADFLYMWELSWALQTHTFELIGFDMCLMAMIEVAHQVHPYCKYMVASEEVESGEGWPYNDWLPKLKNNPAWTGAELGVQIVEDFHQYYDSSRNPATLPSDLYNPDPDPLHTLSCIEQLGLPLLVSSVSRFGADLTLACDDFKAHGSPTDNVQHRIALDSEDAERFLDANYMDLHHFAKLICGDQEIPTGCANCPTAPTGCGCYKVELPTLIPLSIRDGPIVLHEKHGPWHPNANGLSIYMPLTRTRPIVECGDSRSLSIDWPSFGAVDPFGNAIPDPYDYPQISRDTNFFGQRSMYARNDDCLPFLGRDVETCLELADTPSGWPLDPTIGFLFPLDTLWDEFLQRFYHPVADNRILYAECPDRIIRPTVNYPVCGNPIDEITIYPGCLVYFSASGSSDADTPEKLPRHWMWDFDHMSNGCGPCIAPYEVQPGVNASSANDDMDAEHDCSKAPLDDEKEADSQLVGRVFPEIRDYVVTLNVWDDNHDFNFHDTLPTAQYVHPQTDKHTSIVHVVPFVPLIPAVSTWGLLILFLLVSIVGTVLVRKRALA